MKINVDENKCIGCGVCVSVCPDVFEIGENGKSVVKEKETDKKCAKEAAESCPVNAILLN